MGDRSCITSSYWSGPETRPTSFFSTRMPSLRLGYHYVEVDMPVGRSEVNLAIPGGFWSTMAARTFSLSVVSLSGAAEVEAHQVVMGIGGLNNRVCAITITPSSRTPSLRACRATR